MEETINGYVIYSECHPASNQNFLHSSTFRQYKKECISEFIKGTSKDWEYWKRNYNYRCVKATQTVKILNNTNKQIMKRYITDKQFLKYLDKFKTIENKNALMINPIPDLPCYVYCGDQYGIAECENGYDDLGIAELIAVSWILEDELLNLIDNDHLHS